MKKTLILSFLFCCCVFPFVSGCGGSDKSSVVTEGVTPEQIQAMNEATAKEEAETAAGG